MTINSQGQLSSNLPKAYQLYPKGNQNCGNCTHFVAVSYTHLRAHET